MSEYTEENLLLATQTTIELAAEIRKLKKRVKVLEKAVDLACKDACGTWYDNQNCNGCPKKGIVCSKYVSLKYHYINRAMEAEEEEL